MAHTLLNPVTIAEQALATLYESTVMRGLVHVDLTKEFTAAKVGDTVNIRKPATFVAKKFDRSTGIELQDATEGSIPMKVDQFQDVSFAVTDEELSMNIEDFDAQMLTPAMEALAVGMDTALLGLRDDITQEVGTDSAFPWDKPEVLIDAGRILDQNLVPASDRYSVIGPTAKAHWVNTPILKQADQSGNTEALRRASLGRDLFGFETYYTNNIKPPVDAPESGDPTTEVGLAFHNSAFAFASVPLPSNPGSVSHVETFKGVSLRVTMQHDINKKQTIVSIDTLFGIKTLDPNRAVLLKGADAA
jgi:hypothetical protein